MAGGKTARDSLTQFPEVEFIGLNESGGFQCGSGFAVFVGWSCISFLFLFFLDVSERDLYQTDSVCLKVDPCIIFAIALVALSQRQVRLEVSRRTEHR